MRDVIDTARALESGALKEILPISPVEGSADPSKRYAAAPLESVKPLNKEQVASIQKVSNGYCEPLASTFCVGN